MELWEGIFEVSIWVYLEAAGNEPVEMITFKIQVKLRNEHCIYIFFLELFKPFLKL